MNSLLMEATVATVDPAFVSLGTLLQVADLEAVTGVLRVGSVGEVHLRAGLPTDARLAAIVGLDAFYELFIEAASVTELRLVRAESQPEAWGRRPLASLILEGTRRADEWARVSRHVIRLREAAPIAEGQAAFLRALKRSVSVAEAARAAGMPRHHAACVVSGWLDQGHADVVSTLEAKPEARGVVQMRVNDAPNVGRESPLPSNDTTDFFDQLDLGRRALRAGDLAAALVAFGAATAVRPDDRVARQNLRRVESLMGASS